jgi:hypothetical protein
MKRIRLTESQLHRVIKESVNKVLKENYDYEDEPVVFFIYSNDNSEWEAKVLVNNVNEMNILNELEFKGDFRRFNIEPYSNNPNDADMDIKEFVEYFKSNL